MRAENTDIERCNSVPPHVSSSPQVRKVKPASKEVGFFLPFFNVIFNQAGQNLGLVVVNHVARVVHNH